MMEVGASLNLYKKNISYKNVQCISDLACHCQHHKGALTVPRPSMHLPDHIPLT